MPCSEKGAKACSSNHLKGQGVYNNADQIASLCCQYTWHGPSCRVGVIVICRLSGPSIVSTQSTPENKGESKKPQRGQQVVQSCNLQTSACYREIGRLIRKKAPVCKIRKTVAKEGRLNTSEEGGRASKESSGQAFRRALFSKEH
mmetsp:Transcript_125281/g.241474  ORF Transcript_125281/g.241474 Transcript_125281/m.241474 type:complete len:145 (+) Transcript_125281:188-622(+)